MKLVLFRFVRVALSSAVAYALTAYSGNAYVMILAPSITALGKYLRERNPHTLDWLPF